ncbi:chorismate-binding protein [Kiritimatiellaeota bacterium B1221]|nr:chorismate-binding protein [Kiritimatiellaeota bacterium B1221]
MNAFHALQRTDNQGCAYWVHFTGVERCVEAWSLAEVLPAIRGLERDAEKGLHAVGWIAYEASPAFDPHYQVHPLPPDTPFLRFTVYKEQRLGLPPKNTLPCTLSELEPQLNEAPFRQAIGQIHQAIAQGETYQVNFTYPLLGKIKGDPWSLFRQLRKAQSAQHQAYIEEADQIIISASPERFFKHQSDQISCKPMKGTAAPGEEKRLRASLKNRAENIMIVDMIRNDLGKLADCGSVKADHLFEIESFPSLVQMTSTVTANGSGSPVDWLCALFPCASITGAPKRKTMEWIRKLETAPRGIYTGCIGGFFGDGISEFNVAIRTAVIDKTSGDFRYHSGCGIVWDSCAKEEYQESLLKTAVLKHKVDEFQLIETMRGEPDSGIKLWPLHRQRLVSSAAELGMELDPQELDKRIAALTFPETGKVRLTLSEAGKIGIQLSDLPKNKTSMTFRVDTVPTPSTHPQLKHKTSRRRIYEDARKRHPDVDETLLINERGELMEFTIGNLLWVKAGQTFTPPSSSGLLRGVARAALLNAGRLEEKVCTQTDLETADEIYLVNALRGRVKMTTGD